MSRAVLIPALRHWDAWIGFISNDWVGYLARSKSSCVSTWVISLRWMDCEYHPTRGTWEMLHKFEQNSVLKNKQEKTWHCPMSLAKALVVLITWKFLFWHLSVYTCRPGFKCPHSYSSFPKKYLIKAHSFCYIDTCYKLSYRSGDSVCFAPLPGQDWLALNSFLHTPQVGKNN